MSLSRVQQHVLNFKKCQWMNTKNERDLFATFSASKSACMREFWHWKCESSFRLPSWSWNDFPITRTHATPLEVLVLQHSRFHSTLMTTFCRFVSGGRKKYLDSQSTFYVEQLSVRSFEKSKGKKNSPSNKNQKFQSSLINYKKRLKSTCKVLR